MTETEKQDFFQRILHRANEGGYFSSSTGLVYDTVDEASAEGHFTAEKSRCNPYGIVHGGVYYTLMDQMAGMVMAANGVAGVTIDSNISYLRAARLGDTVFCRVERVHLGRSVGVFQGKCFGADGTLQCIGTVHLFVRGALDSMLRLE